MRRFVYIALLVFLFLCVSIRIWFSERARNEQLVNTYSEWAKKGKPVRTALVDRGPILFTIPLSGVPHSKEIDAVATPEMVSWLLPGMAFNSADGGNSGVITFVGRSADLISGLHPVRIRLKSNETAGTLISGTVLAGDKALFTRVPKSALGLNTRVWVTENGRAYERQVTIGHSNSHYVEVKQGLRLADKVVIAGASRLKDGDLVRIESN